jgi:hypothetical protein
VRRLPLFALLCVIVAPAAWAERLPPSGSVTRSWSSWGYLLQKTAPARLLEGIAEVAAGGATISFHMRRIYEKLQVHSKSEGVAKALRHGLVK